MSILVVCPGCHKRFKVSDQYAGQTGPCPKCKAQISIPTKEEEVKVHAPTAFAEGGRSRTGELITKPITRAKITVTPIAAAIVVGAILIVLMAAWIGGKAGLFETPVAGAIGLLLVSPPLALAGYTFLRDDELEPYRGTSLYIRAAICGVAYVGLWGLFSYVANAGFLTGELWEWIVVVPAFLVPGGLIALACLDLDFGTGTIHCGFYVLVTVLLRAVAGLDWIWNVAEPPPI
jgi:hypothetical protein